VAQATTLRRLLDADILVHLPRITDLSDAASREASIEHALDKMLADWVGILHSIHLQPPDWAAFYNPTSNQSNATHPST
jgi:hypothetical protein